MRQRLRELGRGLNLRAESDGLAAAGVIAERVNGLSVAADAQSLASYNRVVSKFGYDYAIKPRVMIVGDIEIMKTFPGKVLGLGYSLLEDYGDIGRCILLTLIFQTAKDGRDCFEHLRSWALPDASTDGLNMSFVDFDDGQYGFFLSQNYGTLAERAFTIWERDEFSPIITATSHMKKFDKSANYFWIKSLRKKHPIILSPGTRAGPMMELAFPKSDIRFVDAKAVDQTMPEWALLGDAISTKEPPIYDIKDMNKRRHKQLRRFFPVTLERLSASPSFLETQSLLVKQGFTLCQIVQAACSITLAERLPDWQSQNARGSADDSPTRVLPFLLNNAEDVNTPPPSFTALTISAVRAQIGRDMHFLLRNVRESGARPKSNNLAKLQKELASSGLTPRFLGNTPDE